MHLKYKPTLNKNTRKNKKIYNTRFVSNRVNNTPFFKGY